MFRRTGFWLALAVLFVLANLGAAGIAAAAREWNHTAVHVVLVLAGEYVVWRLLMRRRAGV
jgi:hypothetical protein